MRTILAILAGCLIISGCSDDSTGSDPECGDDVIEGDEQCDGQDLGGMTCQDMGCMGGTLACVDPGSAGECTFDLGGCTHCNPSCTSTNDCPCSFFCDTDGYECVTYFCGPNGYPNSGDLNGTCTVPGGGDGYCMPVGLAQDDLGACAEAGTVAHGQPCIPDQVRPCDDECDMGTCSTGTCRAFCDPVDVYENDTNSDYCPTGTNCLSMSYIYDQDPDDAGCRASDMGACIEQSTDPQVGEYTCDITNGELIADRNQVCTDVQADLMCIPTPFMDGPGLGTRIGVCRSLAATVSNYWQTCTPGTDTCAEGSHCIEEDTFGSGIGQTRCIPFCDTTNAVPCCQQHSQLPTDNRCRSFSYMYTGGPCTEPVAFHSKLGLCACPVAGCGTGWCGNDVIDGSETCDGSDLGSMNCTNQGCQAGCTLTCNSTCDGTSVTNC